MTLLFLPLPSAMKRLAYITALILSLLIVYVGGGVSIVRYCCARCEAVQGCCETGCPKCKKSHTCDSKKGCREKGCTATIYKLDLMKQTTDQAVSACTVALLCEHFCYLLVPACVDKPAACESLTSPPSPCPKQRLALYSTYLI